MISLKELGGKPFLFRVAIRAQW